MDRSPTRAPAQVATDLHRLLTLVYQLPLLFARRRPLLTSKPT